jgi:hypothetical protein
MSARCCILSFALLGMTAVRDSSFPSPLFCAHFLSLFALRSLLLPAAKCLVMHRSDPTRLQQHALLMCERIDTAVRLMGHMEDGLSRDNLGRGRNPRGQPRPGPQVQGGQKEGYTQNRLSSSGSFSRPFTVRSFSCVIFILRVSDVRAQRQ